MWGDDGNHISHRLEHCFERGCVTRHTLAVRIIRVANESRDNLKQGVIISTALTIREERKWKIYN